MEATATPDTGVPIVVFGPEGGSRPTLEAALASLLDFETTSPWAVVCSERVLLNDRYQEDVMAAVADPEFDGVRWLLLAADGVGFDGELIDNGNYLDRTATPSRYAARAIVSSSFTMAVISLEALRAVGGAYRLFEAWEAGYGSFVFSGLRFSFNGEREAFWGKTPENPLLPTTEQQSDWLQTVRPDPTLTIALRTTFARRAMLERTLRSIASAAALREVESVLVITDDSQQEMLREAAKLRERFPRLMLQFGQFNGTEVPPRTAAMVRAIETASSDYIWFVDDDDWVTNESVVCIKNAVHAAHRPMVLGRSELYHEVWSGNDLISSEWERDFDPRLWYWAFEGWNSLPNCSIVAPGPVAWRRLADVAPRHDMGEDYFLFLLLLTAPGMTVVTVDESIARISIREGGDNVVTMDDRSPWLRSIAGFMNDLSGDAGATSQILWALGQALARSTDQQAEKPTPLIDDSLASGRGMMRDQSRP